MINTGLKTVVVTVAGIVVFSVNSYAQLGPYQVTATAPIGSSTACGSSDYTTSITVSDNIIIADLDFGFLASHTWRSDINITLTSPAATSVNALNGQYINDQMVNYNVRLDDSAGTLVDTGFHTADGTISTVPAYENTVRPEAALSAFNGENANGTWTLSICDTFSAEDDGTFRQANLFFTPVPAVLGANKTVTVWDPTASGLYSLPSNDVIFALTVTNTGNGYTDPNSVFLADSIDSDMVFYNGDIDDDGPETNPVSFVDNGSGLNFSYGSDIAYSNLVAKPTAFSACIYSPTAGYDTNVRHVCVRPSGQLSPGVSNSDFTIKFRARIK